MDLIVTTCRALASKPRLRLLRAIHERPGRTVQVLAAEAGLPIPAGSRHLRLLRSLHLIQTVASGRYVRCSPATPGSTRNEFLQDMQRMLGELFAEGALNRTLAQVCDSVPGHSTGWEAVFNAIKKHVTAFTHLRRLLILRWLANRGPCRTGEIIGGVGLSLDAARRQLEKLERRGVIACTPGRLAGWAVVRSATPPWRRRLLETVLGALKNG